MVSDSTRVIEELKIPRAEMLVPVQVRSPAPIFPLGSPLHNAVLNGLIHPQSGLLTKKKSP